MKAHLRRRTVVSVHDCGPSGELPDLPSSDQESLKRSLSELVTGPIWGFICYDASFLMPLSLPCSFLASSLVFVELVYESHREDEVWNQSADMSQMIWNKWVLDLGWIQMPLFTPLPLGPWFWCSGSGLAMIRHSWNGLHCDEVLLLWICLCWICHY